MVMALLQMSRRENKMESLSIEGVFPTSKTHPRHDSNFLCQCSWPCTDSGPALSCDECGDKQHLRVIICPLCPATNDHQRHIGNKKRKESLYPRELSSWYRIR